MSKRILVLGAGKSTTCLIDYLLKESIFQGWRIIVADSDLVLAQSKTRNSLSAEARSIDIRDPGQRQALIHQADLIIALLPPPLLPLVAADCIGAKKHLITASYLDREFQLLKNKIVESGILVLGEMGLDPGIDHMSALKRIDAIRAKGGHISSFKSHCGGLVSPESDDNPWHYKISWNPRNIVLAGSTGAVYKEGGRLKETGYHSLFNQCEQVTVPLLGKLACYPNRDSLHYQAVYNLHDADTFLRTTLRHPDFCTAWHAVVTAGLTCPDDRVPHPVSFRKWSERVQSFITVENRQQLSYLGLFDAALIPAHLYHSLDAIQYLFEKNLSLRPSDRDMIVMLHQIRFRENSKEYLLESTLVVEGKNAWETAMAQTVGLPLGIAAKLILQDKIHLRGLHIPVHPEIYEPVLAEFAGHGIRFSDTIKQW